MIFDVEATLCSLCNLFQISNFLTILIHDKHKIFPIFIGIPTPKLFLANALDQRFRSCLL